MTALTEDRDLNRMVDQELREYGVLAAETIYKGSLVGRHPALGYVKAFKICDEFLGVAYENANNSAGSSGDTDGRTLGTVDQEGLVRLFTEGDFTMTLASVAVTDIGKAVFAQDDGSIALTGHWDGFVGRIIAIDKANTPIVRLKEPFTEPKMNEGALKIETDFVGEYDNVGGAGGEDYFAGFELDGANGLGVVVEPLFAEGAFILWMDAQEEAAFATIWTQPIFDIVMGVSYFVRLYIDDDGTSTTDFDWGLGNVRSDTIKADMDDGSLTVHARFHVNGANTAILAEADDNTIDVAAADTGVVNVETAGAYKDFHILIRGDNAVPEFYIDGARVLTSTFDTVVLMAGLVAGFVNAEKASGATLIKVPVEKLRIAGGSVAIVT